MHWRVTIPGKGSSDNGAAPRVCGLVLAISGAAAGLLAGCAAPARTAPTLLSVEDFAGAEPVTPIALGRARISYDRPLPAECQQRLCDEFALVVIRSAGQWAPIRRRFKVPAGAGIDFSRGMVVALQADIGECTSGRWPLNIAAARVCAGQACVEAAVEPGVYYPVRSAGYLVFAYLPGVRSVAMVRIAGRVFLIRPTRPG